MDILKVLLAFTDTPVPVLLVAGGIFFLFIGVGGQISGGKENASRKVASIIGVLLLFTGIAMYAIPTVIESPETTLTISADTVSMGSQTLSTATAVKHHELNLRSACGTEYVILANVPIELRYGGWIARGMELAKNNAEHLSVKLTVDGQVVIGQKQSVRAADKLYPGSECGSIDYEDGFGTYFVAYLDSLPPGEHYVEIEYSFDEQVTDGYDNNQDGVLDLYGPGALDTLRFTIIANP